MSYTPAVAGAAHQFETGDSPNGPSFAQPATGDLSDYASGPFTPAIRGGGTAGSATYSLQFGRYNKIGDLIIVTFGVQWLTFTGATGDFQVTTGLSYVSVNDPDAAFPGALNDFTGITLDTGFVWLGPEVIAATNVITFEQAASTKTSHNLGVTGVAGAGYIAGTVIYTTT